MSALWYYASNGKQMDPVSLDELQKLASSGFLKPADLVWREGMASWVKASTVANLFPSKAAASTAVTPKRAPAAAAASKPVAVVEPELVSEEEEDRPRRRRRRDDDYDDEPERPRRRRPRDDSGNTGLKIALIGGGIVLALVLIVVVVIVAVRGGSSNSLPVPPGGTELLRFSVTVSGMREEMRSVQLKAGNSYEAQLKSDGNNDVDIVIHGPNGQIVAMDESIGPNGFVRFFAATDGQYRVAVRNLDGRSIRSHVLVSQLPGGGAPVVQNPPLVMNPPVINPPPIIQPPVINPPNLPGVGGGNRFTQLLGLIPPHQRRTINRDFPAGQQVRVRVQSATVGRTDVDLFIKHNGQLVAADTGLSSQCNVMFVSRGGMHEIEVENLGPGSATCTVIVE